MAAICYLFFIIIESLVILFDSVVKIVDIPSYVIVEASGISVDVVEEGCGGLYLMPVNLVTCKCYLYRGSLDSDVRQLARGWIEYQRGDIIRAFVKLR